MRGAASLLSGGAHANHDASMTLHVHVSVACTPCMSVGFGPICVVDGENECRTMPRGRRAAPRARAPQRVFQAL